MTTPFVVSYFSSPFHLRRCFSTTEPPKMLRPIMMFNIRISCCLVVVVVMMSMLLLAFGLWQPALMTMIFHPKKGRHLLLNIFILQYYMIWQLKNTNTCGGAEWSTDWMAGWLFLTRGLTATLSSCFSLCKSKSMLDICFVYFANDFVFFCFYCCGIWTCWPAVCLNVLFDIHFLKVMLTEI